MKTQRKGAETQRTQRKALTHFALSASPRLCVRFYGSVTRDPGTACLADCKPMILFVWMFLALNSHSSVIKLHASALDSVCSLFVSIWHLEMAFSTQFMVYLS